MLPGKDEQTGPGTHNRGGNRASQPLLLNHFHYPTRFQELIGVQGEKKRSFPTVSAKKILGVQSGSSREGRWTIFIKLLGTVGIFYCQCQKPVREEI